MAAAGAAAKLSEVAGGPVASGLDKVIRNLNGQKLGRKGRDTRARIIAAAAELVADGSDVPVTLSAVARRCSLGMTSLYVYFNDLTELLIAVLEPVAATAEEAFMARLRPRWPDEELGVQSRRFVEAYHAYWLKHAPLLHLRNAMADAHDRPMMELRIEVALPMIHLFAAQMGAQPSQTLSPAYAMASLLMTGLERAATVWTDTTLHRMFDGLAFSDTERFLVPASRLIELAIRDARVTA